MADEDRTFHTSTPETNRAEQQGLGVGQRELDAQRDAGEPPELEVEDVIDDNDPDGRTVKTEAERGQGAKTRAANKDIISRRS